VREESKKVSALDDELYMEKRKVIGLEESVRRGKDSLLELRNKYEVYEESGVLEYWIIHPQEKTFLKYTLVRGNFQPSRLLTLGDEVTTPVLPGFVLKLDELFADR